MNNHIIPSMIETLFNPVFSNMGSSLIDIAEIGLDNVLEEGFLRDIPVLGTIAALCKTGLNIQERHLIRQTALFIQSFNQQSLTDEALQTYRKELEKNSQKAEREIGRVILLLDRMLEEQQAKSLGKLYKGFISGLLMWDEFVELSEANARMFVSDYAELKSIINSPIKQDDDISDQVLYKINRLESLGLVMENRTRLNGTTLHYAKSDNRFEPTPIGKKFFDLAIK